MDSTIPTSDIDISMDDDSYGEIPQVFNFDE